MTRPFNKQPIVGAGLILARNRGERIMISADPAASDAELLAALREGLVITVVDIYEYQHPNRKTVRPVAEVGIRASKHLSIAREEIINRQNPKKETADGNLHTEVDTQTA